MAANYQRISATINATNTNSTIPIIVPNNSGYFSAYCYLMELSAHCQISSVAAYVPPDLTAYNINSLQDMIDWAYYTSTLNNPGKQLNLFSGDLNGNLNNPIGSVIIFNRQPYSMVDLTKLIVSKMSNYIVLPGEGIYANLSQWNNNGLLSGSDLIAINGIVYCSDVPL